MSELSQEEAVANFSQLTKPFLSSSVNPRLLIDAVINFYRDFRILGTIVENDGDMLLLQWGTTKPNLISGFTDFRHLSDSDISYDAREFQYFNPSCQLLNKSLINLIGE